MAQDEQDDAMPYPSSFARTNARLTAALDRGAMVLTAPLRRLGVDFTVDPQPRPPRLAPKLWIPLTLCTLTTGMAAWQVLGRYHGWAMATIWFPFLISLLSLSDVRSRHPILRKPAEERTEAERRIVGQCWMAMAVTIALLASIGLALTAFHVAMAPAPVDGLDLARRIIMGLFFTECLAFMMPVIVLSWHDHRPDDAFPRLADMKKPFSESIR
ncbi:hypothetical protein ACLRDC_02620 [Gluconacetobacter sacchari]|uniref:Uncharacterized protein n=2 Tax=Gluconacetobacter sacchari TaxID=92759 RepID=A0A7W4IAW8_9PROT|nr:hypothetical protein [Gluconacetobacter sacchari]MBB2159511.1 hypothetical protein [Gluconacetobacter sacchari]GBQ32149.1 hypothetical protein AA12717_3949 [Gluconacetobacter sacchari DSM 12717]